MNYQVDIRSFTRGKFLGLFGKEVTLFDYKVYNELGEAVASNVFTDYDSTGDFTNRHEHFSYESALAAAKADIVKLETHHLERAARLEQRRLAAAALADSRLVIDGAALLAEL